MMLDDDKDFGRTPDLNADAPGRRRGGKKRVCKYCADKAVPIDYKDPQALKYFVSERGKVVPRRISGNCARHRLIALPTFSTRYVMPATLQLILQHDVDKVGKSGELIKVRPGFARNFLIPRQLAVPATTAHVNRISHEKAVAVAKSEKLKASSREMAEKINKLEIKIARSVGEDDKLFGSVTAKEIENAVKAQGIEFDRKKMQLAEPLKALGTYEIPIKLLSDVTATLKVEVTKK
jgi:large subunit ribosomal protein L9